MINTGLQSGDENVQQPESCLNSFTVVARQIHRLQAGINEMGSIGSSKRADYGHGFFTGISLLPLDCPSIDQLNVAWSVFA